VEELQQRRRIEFKEKEEGVNSSRNKQTEKVRDYLTEEVGIFEPKDYEKVGFFYLIMRIPETRGRKRAPFLDKRFERSFERGRP